MKRILTSLLIVAILVTSVTVGTHALFTDSGTVEGNTFTAGTLDLKVNGQDSATSSYTLTNIKPGAWDLAGQVVLKNDGTVKGHVWYEITNVRNYENTCLGPEADDNTCGTGIHQGELGSLAKASLQKNVAPWTRYPSSNILTINAAEGVRYEVEDLNPGDTLPIVVYGVWPNGSASDDNMAQSDSVVFDVVFHLDQI